MQLRRPLFIHPLLPLILLLAACEGGNKKAPTPPPARVKVATLAEQPIARTADLLGALNSRQAVTLTPQVAGHVSSILVKPGEKVKEGQALLQIDPQKERATLASLESVKAARESALRLAQDNYDRAAKLAPAGVMSSQELQQAQSALASAKADLSAAESQMRAQQVQLEYYRITAPYAGEVGDIPVKVGDLVGPQTPLLMLNQSAILEAEVSVPLTLAPRLNRDTTTLSLLSDDEARPLVEARLSFISPSVDPGTQSVLVKAVFPNTQGLKFAQFVRARITFDTRSGLKVPTTAVSRMSGQYFVFVVQPGDGGAPVVQQRNVQLGEIVGDGYVVVDGLKAGDRVVTQGIQKVRNGAKVAPEEEAPPDRADGGSAPGQAQSATEAR